MEPDFYQVRVRPYYSFPTRSQQLSAVTEYREPGDRAHELQQIDSAIAAEPQE